MAVLVRAPSRLHLGFIPPLRDDNSPGSATVSISSPSLEIVFRESEDVEVSGPCSEDFFYMALSFMEHYLPDRGVEIEVKNAIKRHVGFGSGTRMALSVGMGISSLYGLGLEALEIARFFGRGKNSMAGLESLLKGGLALIHPGGSVSNMEFPEEWHFIVALPELKHNFFGEEEREVMSSLKTRSIDSDLAAMLERSLLRKDIVETGKALERIDSETGKLFSHAQDGSYSHGSLERIVDAGKSAGAYGAGQSSWGPALYFLVDERVSRHVERALLDAIGENGAVERAPVDRNGISIEKIDDAGSSSE